MRYDCRMPLRRRELLLVAGSAVAGAAAGRAEAAGPLAAAAGLGTGLQPELVSVDEAGFTAWWTTPSPADTTVRYARAGGGPVREVTLERGVTIHAAHVEGLEPGTLYRYELRSGGRRIARWRHNPGVVRTLALPPGELRATIAVMNDLHVGERCSGTVVTVGGQSIPPCFRGDDYAARMTAAAVAEIAALRPDFVLVNGDLTDDAEPGETERARALLDGLGVPWQATRGNHDRPGQGASATCTPDADCFRSAFFPAQPVGAPAVTWVARVGARHAVVGLDSSDPETGDGRLDLGGQLAWLDATLATLRAEGRQAIVGFHHPITTKATETALPPKTFGVRRGRGGEEALRILARHDHVALVLHGHTHRNFVTYDGQVGHRAPFLETGAVKEYPAMWHLVRCYDGGLVRTAHRMRDAFARTWTRTSARQFYGLQPLYTRGPLSARAFTHLDGCARENPPASLVASVQTPRRGSCPA